MVLEKIEVTESRKKDHINLAFQSQVNGQDDRFTYEPLLSAHPQGNIPPAMISGKKMNTPLWVSSMTGGTEKAGLINHNLARACAEFGMGMGLGSCRIILEDSAFFEDFNLRPIMGDGLPFYANLGVAQLEPMILAEDISPAVHLVERLKADGLIIHVNPLQEWLQPEGDVFTMAPLEVVKYFVAHFPYPIIVKEVGQGMGPESLEELLRLPLQAVEFAAHGGTNFALLELLRADAFRMEMYESLTKVGHNAFEMVDFTNAIAASLGNQLQTKELIISGGLKDFLDGYYLIKKSTIPAVYGQASSFLKHATGDYETLRAFVDAQVKGLDLAYAYLKLKS